MLDLLNSLLLKRCRYKSQLRYCLNTYSCSPFDHAQPISWKLCASFSYEDLVKLERQKCCHMWYVELEFGSPVFVHVHKQSLERDKELAFALIKI